jgi:hypothetical protein
MVVWFARPIFWRSRSGSKPGLVASWKRSTMAPASSVPADEVAHDLGLGTVLHDQELAAGVRERLRRRRLRLLVVVLAVDHRGVAVARVADHVLPDVEHAAAGGVDEHAAFLAQVLELAHRHPEGRQDHDVGLVDGRVALVRLLLVLQDHDPERFDASVDLGVVDDLAREEDAPVRELLARLVRVLDGAVDPVAEAELAGQLHLHVARLGGVAETLQAVDDLRVVALRQPPGARRPSG